VIGPGIPPRMDRSESRLIPLRHMVHCCVALSERSLRSLPKCGFTRSRAFLASLCETRTRLSKLLVVLRIAGRRKEASRCRRLDVHDRAPFDYVLRIRRFPFPSLTPTLLVEFPAGPCAASPSLTSSNLRIKSAVSQFAHSKSAAVACSSPGAGSRSSCDSGGSSDCRSTELLFSGRRTYRAATPFGE
jgi:hypothetical protein